jgi:single-strand DNA-binding protein
MEERVTIQATVMSDPVEEEVFAKIKMVTFWVQTNVQAFDLRMGGYTENNASAYKVIVFNQLARNVFTSVKKGERVIVAGLLYIRPDPRNKMGVTQAEVKADVVGHDLNWYRTVATRD